MRDRFAQWVRTTPPMAWGSLAAAVAALIAIGIMNIAFGEYIGATEAGKRIYSLVSMICATAGTVVFGLMGGKLIGEKRRAAAIMPMLVFFIAIAWDLASVSGFNATERLSATAIRRAAIDADQRDAEERAKLREKYVERLQGVATIHGASRSERRDFLSAASAEIAKPVVSAGPPRLLADAQAEMIVKGLAILGHKWTVDDVQLAIIAHMSILLVLIESFGFYYTTYLRALYLREQEDKNSRGSSSGGGGTRKPFETIDGGKLGTDGTVAVHAAVPEGTASVPAQIHRSDVPSWVPRWVVPKDAASVDGKRVSRSQLDRIVSHYMGQQGPKPSVRDVAEWTGWSKSKVSKVECRARGRIKINPRTWDGAGVDMMIHANG